MTNASEVTGSGWVAVMTSRELTARPKAIFWNGQPLAVFRSGDGVAAISDICPHRQAPLSEGQVVGGQIECPYHGWRFDGAGVCQAMPGHLGELPRLKTQAFKAKEVGGLIFIASREEAGEPYVSALWGEGTVMRTAQSRAGSNLAEVVENILDATHTHFTHKGLLRGLNAKRYQVTVTITGGPGWVEAHYEGEPRQEGLMSKLLEGARSTAVGRFVAPGIAELEMRGPNGINLCTTFHLRESETGIVEGVGLLTGPLEGGLGVLKSLIFMPLFRVALAQDKYILSRAHQWRQHRPAAKTLYGPLDILRPHIDAILKGEIPTVADNPQTMVMEL